MAAPQRSSRSHGTSSRPPCRRSTRPQSRAGTMEGPCSPPANPAPSSTPFPIVGIGASAGGLEALEVFLRHMPPDSDMAFVIVTHMDPQTTSFLPELLRRATRMPVHEATDKQPLRPDEVFVTVPGKYLAVEQATLTVRDMLSAHGIPLPIDAFFRSLAADQQDKAIGIILSGTGTDGTLGAKAIKSASGMVMVQDAQSARFAGMPCNALATGLVDYVLPPDQMPADLLAYVRGPYLSRSPDPTPPPSLSCPKCCKTSYRSSMPIPATALPPTKSVQSAGASNDA